MFSFFSQLKVKRVLFACLVFVLLAASIGACKSDVEGESTKGLPDALLGKWVSSNFGDWFEITRSGSTETLKISFDGTTVGSQGIIRDVTNFDTESGVIIVEYSSGTYVNPEKPFEAVYYVQFTGDTVSLNSAYDPNGTGTATLAEAIAKFTKASMFDYVNAQYFATYSKQ